MEHAGLPGDARSETRQRPISRDFPAPELLSQVEAAIAARQQAAKDATHEGRGRALGISAGAHVMRERRANPEVRRIEKLKASARNRALEQLARNHPEEMLALVQIERKKLGLAVLVPRQRRSNVKLEEVEAKQPVKAPKPKPAPVQRPKAPQSVLIPPPIEVQNKCRHNMGLTKLSYGTFCVECGHKVR